MAAFANPLDGARFFETLVSRLRTVVWDDRGINQDGSTDGFKAVPHEITMQHNYIEKFSSTGNVPADVNHVKINLSEALPEGMMCSAGLCHGPLAKQMEASGCADYQGPAANRSARLCGKAKPSQLFIMERQREVFDIAIAAGELDATVEPAGEVVLKGMGPTKVCAIIPAVRASKLGGGGGDGDAHGGNDSTRGGRRWLNNVDRAKVTAMPTMAERVSTLSLSGATGAALSKQVMAGMRRGNTRPNGGSGLGRGSDSR